MFDLNDTTDATVSADTDDLDTFSDDLFQVKPKAPAAETITSDPEVTDTEDEVKISNEAEPVEGTDADEPEVKTEPKKNRVQDRINQLLERERIANERAEAAERKLQERDSSKEPTRESKPVVDDGPAPDDTLADGTDKYPLGEFDPNYIRDMARHTIDKEWTLRKEQEAQQTAQRQEQEVRNQLQTKWVEKVETVQNTHEDFVEKTLELEETFEGLDPQYSDYLVQTIKSLDYGPEVLYYFANNLEEAQKFVRMGPNAATLALGEYNAMFKGQSRKETKVSKAPPPPQVNKGATMRTVVAGDTDDLDAFSTSFFKKR